MNIGYIDYKVISVGSLCNPSIHLTVHRAINPGYLQLPCGITGAGLNDLLWTSDYESSGLTIYVQIYILLVNLLFGQMLLGVVIGIFGSHEE